MTKKEFKRLIILTVIVIVSIVLPIILFHAPLKYLSPFIFLLGLFAYFFIDHYFIKYKMNALAKRLLEKKNRLRDDFQSRKDNSSIEGEELKPEQFWQREFDRCKNGLWVNGKLVETSLHYFNRCFINIKMEVTKEEQEILTQRKEKNLKTTLYICNEARKGKDSAYRKIGIETLKLLGE